MKGRAIAIKGMLILMCVVFLCLFFSGTIKTIVTPKVQFVTVKSGRLTHHYQYTGAVVYPGAEAFYYPTSQPVIIAEVYVSPGDSVKAGDVLFSMQHLNASETETQLKNAYHDALLQRMDFEQEYAGYQPDPRAQEYRNALKALQRATIEEGEASLLVSRILPAGVTVPEQGYPEGVTASAQQAIDAWRIAAAEKALAKADFEALTSEYSLSELDQQYDVRDMETAEAVDAAGRALNAFYLEQEKLKAVCAPRECTIATVDVRSGSIYDAGAPLCMLMDVDDIPVIEIVTEDMERVLPHGASVDIMTPWGEFQSEVVETGLTTTGNPYAHIAIPDALAEKGISAAMLGEAGINVSVGIQSENAYSLVPVSAIHGSGSNRYVYVVEENKAALGGSEMQVSQLNITVVDEVDGYAAVEEKLTRVQLAYLEDRPLSDGCTVMGYVP